MFNRENITAQIAQSIDEIIEDLQSQPPVESMSEKALRNEWINNYAMGRITKAEFDSDEKYDHWISTMDERRQEELQQAIKTKQFLIEQNKIIDRLKANAPTLEVGDVVCLHPETEGDSSNVGTVTWVMESGSKKGKLLYVLWGHTQKEEKMSSWELTKIS